MAAVTPRLSSLLPPALLALAVICPPAAAQTAVPATDLQAAPAGMSPAATAQYHVLAGEMAAARNMPRAAAQEFLKALAIIADPQLAGRATSLALNANDEPLALAAAQRWLEIEPDSLDAREVILLLSLRQGVLADAHAQAVAIVRDHPGGEADGFRHVALLMVTETSRSEAALALMQQLVGAWPQLAGAHYALGLLAMRFNQTELAEKAARESLRLEPDADDATLLLAGVQLKKGEVEAAERSMDDVARRSPAQTDLRMGYARMLLEAGERDRARRQFRLILEGEPRNTDARYALGLMALEDEKLDEAVAQFALLVERGERMDDAAYYLGRIEESRRNFGGAQRWYQQVDNGTHMVEAAVRSATMLGRLKRLGEARTELEQLRRQFPPLAPRFYAVEGEILITGNQPLLALEVYDAALALTPADADLLYGRSLAHEKLRRIDAAEADLRAILAQEPDESRALNALGYLLTVYRGDRLDEARGLISRALALDPEDAAIIDSMGWVEFRLGRAEEARRLLQRAYEMLPDPEIAAHLGEVLWTLGDQERARSVWDEARKAAPDHEVLYETVKRLTAQ